MYRPTHEKDVVLKCGCLGTPYGAINTKLEGKNQEIQYCERHEEWVRIIRDATECERFRFYFYREAIPTRKTKQALGDVLAMPVGNTVQKSNRFRDDWPTLF